MQRGHLDASWGVALVPAGLGAPIRIDGLRGLRFGNAVFGGPRSPVFSAGIDDEVHGLLGTVRAA